MTYKLYCPRPFCAPFVTQKSLRVSQLPLALASGNKPPGISGFSPIWASAEKKSPVSDIRLKPVPCTNLTLQLKLEAIDKTKALRPKIEKAVSQFSKIEPAWIEPLLTFGLRTRAKYHRAKNGR